MAEQKRKHGGHNAGAISPRNSGSGPVYELRTRLGLTRKQLSERTSISVIAIQKWEQAGVGPVREIYKQALAKAGE